MIFYYWCSKCNRTFIDVSYCPLHEVCKYPDCSSFGLGLCIFHWGDSYIHDSLTHRKWPDIPIAGKKYDCYESVNKF